EWLEIRHSEFRTPHQTAVLYLRPSHRLTGPGMLDPDDPTAPEDPSDAGVAMAVDRLGEPQVTYQVSPVLFWGKLALGLALVLFGVVSTILWFTIGPASVGHWEFHLLFWPTFLGIMLLV